VGWGLGLGLGSGLGLGLANQPNEARASQPPSLSSLSSTWSSGALVLVLQAMASAQAVSTPRAREVWLKKMTPLPVVGVLACSQSVSLPG
jgi:hypothetical protein